MRLAALWDISGWHDQNLGNNRPMVGSPLSGMLWSNTAARERLGRLRTAEEETQYLLAGPEGVVPALISGLTQIHDDVLVSSLHPATRQISCVKVMYKQYRQALLSRINYSRHFAVWPLQ